MSKIIITAVTALILSVSMQASATYQNGQGYKKRCMAWDNCRVIRQQSNKGWRKGNKYHNVPELSSAAAPVSIALVTGLLAFGLERRRKSSKK